MAEIEQEFTDARGREVTARCNHLVQWLTLNFLINQVPCIIMEEQLQGKADKLETMS